MNLAPVVLFVYNRPFHTRQTLEALSRNDMASEIELIVFCDGPKNNCSEKILEDIELVRTICKLQTWPKKKIIYESTENNGLAKSVISGISKVFETYHKVIVLEDDIIIAPYFIKFMNQALDAYANERKVYGISGYKYPSLTEVKENTFFLPIACSWGYATWKDRWGSVNFDAKSLFNTISKKGLKKKMNFGGYKFYEMLQDQISGKVDSWAIRFYSSMFIENSFFLYPKFSLVENIGFDSSGTHCTEDEFFSSIDLNKEAFEFKKIKVKLNTKIVNLTRKEFEKNTNSKSNNLIKRIKGKLKKYYST